MTPKRRRSARPAPRFHREMIIAEILQAHPGAREVLEKRGLPCHRCLLQEDETLEQGCAPLALAVDEILAELEALPADASA
jgi:hybrid cluster-associated redox disulfide protein